MAEEISPKTETYIFLCNPDIGFYSEAGSFENRELPEIIKTKLSGCEYFFTEWRCANNKSIRVGDKAYLLKTVEGPKGFIASGKVVEAPKEIQLRQYPEFSNLSPAYRREDQGNYYVWLALDSVVDFEHPLEQRTLESQPVFRDVNFYFAGGGKRFAPNHPAAVKALTSAWESHCLILQRQGKARRLIDVFLEWGDEAKRERAYDDALYYYNEALEIDPKYGKAVNKVNQLKRIIGTKQEATDSPTIITPPPESPPVDQPTDLPLQEALEDIREELVQQDYTVNSDVSEAVSEAQKRVLVEIARRQGQSKFRQALLDAYGYKCAVTGFDAGEALEAAHIIPYVETENNDPTNGLLLRADIHTLFDLNSLAIHPESLIIYLHPDLKNTQYRNLQGQKMRIPNISELRPNPQYLKKRLQQCLWFNSA